MMIFPKKIHQDAAPKEPLPARQPASAAEREGKLPETWRVVLEDGSTSDSLSNGPAPGAGKKLMDEVTRAVQGQGKRPAGPVRARSVAMPSSPLQPLDEFDDFLPPQVASRSQPARDVGRPASAARPSQAAANVPGAQASIDRPLEREGAADTCGVLKARAGSSRRDLDARLARVIESWPQLSRGIQAAILALVEAEASDPS